MAGKRGAGTKKELRSLPQALSPAQNMAGGKKKNPPQKGDESYAERFDARYDDSPEVRALPPSLLTEWRANRGGARRPESIESAEPTAKRVKLNTAHRSLVLLQARRTFCCPTALGCRTPDAVAAWLARNQATKKSCGNTKKTAGQTEAQNHNWRPSDPSLVQCAIPLAGADRRGGRALWDPIPNVRVVGLWLSRLHSTPEGCLRCFTRTTGLNRSGLRPWQTCCELNI